jgi:hypothetical protein
MGDKNNHDAQKKKVIPLNKTYMWGIVFCLAALIAIVMFNILREPSIPATKIDYLALLRDNHNRSMNLRGFTRKGGKTLGDLQSLMAQKIGAPVIFPDWLGTDPLVEIIGVKATKIGDDKTVNLVFKYDHRHVDFLILHTTRTEIKELNNLTQEEHEFHSYSWGRTNAFYWELTEDNLPVTYGLISDIESSALQQMAFETMLSLRTHFERL